MISSRCELKLHPGRQKGDPLKQPFDIGIDDLDPVHAQTRGDLGKGLGKLGPHIAHECQFAFVVFQQSGIHGGVS